VNEQQIAQMHLQ